MLEILESYHGSNPFIVYLKQEIFKRNLSAFEEEYIRTNINYSGYKFHFAVKLKVGAKNVEYLNKQFGTDKTFEEISIENLIGETSNIYHFGYKQRSFFVYKDDCENPFKKEINSVEFDPTPFDNNNNWGRKLYPHQVEGVKFMMLQNPAFCWDDVGLGKTAQSIVAALASGYRNVLVVTLASLKLNWRREIENYRQSAKIISGSEWNDSKTMFTIINYEILKNFVVSKKAKNQKDSTNQLLKQQYDCVILDEVHRAKNPKSIQSDCINAICSQNSVKKIIGLSGTPFERNIDFYNICRTVNKNITDVVLVNGWIQDVIENYREYALRYCNAYEQVLDSPKTKRDKAEILALLSQEVKSFSRVRGVLNIIQQHGIRVGKLKNWQIGVNGTPMLVSNLNVKDCQWLLKQGFEDRRKKIMVLGQKQGDVKVENSNTDELYLRIRHTQIIRKKTDILEYFPAKIIFPLYFDLSPKEKVEYRELWDEYLTEKNIKGLTPEDLMEMSRSIKMREFLALLKCSHTCNFIENKIEEGLKVIVFTHFKNEYEYFLKHFGKLAIGLHATMSAEKKQAIIDKYQQDDNVKVIVGNIKTLGTGHNITKGDVAIINSPDWNSGEHEQAEGRSWRIGRTEDVTVYYCLFEDTHEEKVFERSNQKKDNKDILLQT